MEAGATTTMNAKLPILNPGEYDIWLMRIEQYFLMTDYSFWEVIKNGNKVLTKLVGLSEQTYEPTTAEEKQDRRNEMKARGTLLMALPNKDQLKFHSYQDAKLLMEAIEKRYRGNKESKKVQRTLLKRKYENFTASSLETLDQTFDKLQKLISQLELQGEIIQQEDMNLKLLRSLPSEWKTHALIWRNKAELETISLECRAPRNQDNRLRDSGRTTVPVETPKENALIAQDGIGGVNDSTTRERAVVNGNTGREIQVYNGLDPQKSQTLLFYVKGNPQQKEYKEKRVIDIGCSRHMIGYKCYLIDFKAFDGGFVSFGDGKGRISGKGKIKTGKLDFDDMYFCKELNQVLLRVPRKDNIYSVDLKSVVPTGGLTCLFAKATLDESNSWHRRPGHINFKTMNKLVKGNLREYSIARTPQQNRVAERRNRTPIEAARTMALVTKPHNKTPYELIRGRPPLIDFMKPFGCHVAILNTRDNLGKFEGKLMRDILLGTQWKWTNWLFDIDSLTISISYMLVVTRNQTNGIAGTKEKLVAGQDEKKKELEQEYILIPICTTGPLISQDAKDSAEDDGKKAPEVDVGEGLDNDRKDNQVSRSEDGSLFQQDRQTKHNNNTNDINTLSSLITAGPSFVNAASQIPLNVAGPSASTNAFKKHSFE
uniref:GAG-pre-integrase domain-containing protein n=1 Tax=Tanacetum cinerariifolium TaxID=118510 RepID=A0A6L2N8P9_TANCI|nr:hypothetical protein [Tanacetum cinerariifolium]